jgi:hypothetical protein
MSRATPQIGHAELCTTTASFLGHEILPSVCGIVARQGLNFRRKFATVKPMTDQDEITRLKNEIAQLQARLEAQQLPIRSNTTPLIENYELIQDACRFAEGLITEKAVRKKWHFDETTWSKLGEDEAFIEKVDRERDRRTKTGACARERAQQVFEKCPPALEKILDDKSANPRHVVEVSREIRAIAAVGPEAQPTTEMFTININLGANEVIRFSKPIAPGLDDNGNVIEQKPLPMLEDGNDKSI